MLSFGLMAAFIGLEIFVIFFSGLTVTVFGIILFITHFTLNHLKTTRLIRKNGVFVFPKKTQVLILGAAPVFFISVALATYPVITALGSEYFLDTLSEFTSIVFLLTAVAGVIAFGYERNMRKYASPSEPSTPLEQPAAGQIYRSFIISVSFAVAGIVSELVILAMTIYLLDKTSVAYDWGFLQAPMSVLPLYSILLAQSWLHWRRLMKESPGRPQENFHSVAISTVLQLALLSITITAVFSRAMSGLN